MINIPTLYRPATKLGAGGVGAWGWQALSSNPQINKQVFIFFITNVLSNANAHIAHQMRSIKTLTDALLQGIIKYQFVIFYLHFHTQIFNRSAVLRFHCSQLQIVSSDQARTFALNQLMDEGLGAGLAILRNGAYEDFVEEEKRLPLAGVGGFARVYGFDDDLEAFEFGVERGGTFVKRILV